MQAWKAMARQEVGGAGSAPQQGPPTGVAVFAADNTFRAALDPGRTMARWTTFDRGGHFPGMEVPDLLVEELRSFFAEHR